MKKLRVGIIGAGIQGVCNALFLQKKGFEVVLFDKEDPGHYRIFGWFQVGEIIKLGDNPSWYLKENPNSNSHPHTIGKWPKNNTLYIAKLKLEGFDLRNFPTPLIVPPVPTPASKASMSPSI